MDLEADRTITRVFEKSEKAIMYITDSSQNSKNPGYQNFEKLAENFRGKIAFVSVNSKKPNGKQFVKYESITGLPKLIGVEGNTEHADKFNYEGEMEYQPMKIFFEKFLEGKLEKEMKSEDVPEGNEKNIVKKIVRKNWEGMIKSRSTFFLLKIYAPWCGHSKRVSKKFSKLYFPLKNYFFL